MISGIGFNCSWFILGAIAGFLFAIVGINYDDEEDNDDISEEEKNNKKNS